MLTKDGDSTTDTEDGDEDARPGREEREEKSQTLFERKKVLLQVEHICIRLLSHFVAL
jgi:hypothetical protein